MNSLTDRPDESRPARRGRWRDVSLVLGLMLALTGCASWNDWQRQTIYRPTRLQDAAQWSQLLASRPDADAITVPVDDGQAQMQVLRLVAHPGQTSPVRVLYLHGTFRHAWQNRMKAQPMLAAGLDVFLPDYRGWGASSPRVPSEDSIFSDAWSAWQALQVPAGQPPVRWIVFGHSMGSAVAVQLAQRLRGQGAYCALVLESAFTSFPDVAEATVGWGGRLLSLAGPERMASIDRIGQVDPPVWFMHGELDKTVPLALGRRLYEAAPQPRHWAVWPLGHSNLQDDPSGRYAQVWRDIAAGCGVR